MSSREIRKVIACLEEPKVNAGATERIVQILDSDYHKSRFAKSDIQKSTVDTDPVNIELRERTKLFGSRGFIQFQKHPKY